MPVGVGQTTQPLSTIIDCRKGGAWIYAYRFNDDDACLPDRQNGFSVTRQDSSASEYNTLPTGQRLALTYSQMMKSAVVLTTMIDKLDLKKTVEGLSSNVSVETVRDTQLIRVNVKDSSPEQAAKLADPIAEVFTTHIQILLRARYTSSLESMRRRLTFWMYRSRNADPARHIECRKE